MKYQANPELSSSRGIKLDWVELDYSEALGIVYSGWRRHIGEVNGSRRVIGALSALSINMTPNFGGEKVLVPLANQVDALADRLIRFADRRLKPRDKQGLEFICEGSPLIDYLQERTEYYHPKRGDTRDRSTKNATERNKTLVLEDDFADLAVEGMVHYVYTKYPEKGVSVEFHKATTNLVALEHIRLGIIQDEPVEYSGDTNNLIVVPEYLQHRL